MGSALQQRAPELVRQAHRLVAALCAGMRKDDLIVVLNGVKIKSWEGLVEAIGKQKAGDVFTVTVVREGKEVELKGMLGRF